MRIIYVYNIINGRKSPSLFSILFPNIQIIVHKTFSFKTQYENKQVKICRNRHVYIFQGDTDSSLL